MSRYARQARSSWAECAICGFDFPQIEMVRHYRFGFLVDAACSDELAHLDYMERLRLPEIERPNPTMQKVPEQGQAIRERAKWNSARWNDGVFTLSAGPSDKQGPE